MFNVEARLSPKDGTEVTCKYAVVKNINTISKRQLCLWYYKYYAYKHNALLKSEFSVISCIMHNTLFSVIILSNYLILRYNV